MAGDLDADGQVGVTDLLAMLGFFGQELGPPADLNGDNIIGVQDILTLLSQFATVC